MRDNGEPNSNQHSNEVYIVVQSDVITDPDTVVVELIDATIASLAVLCVLENVGVTNFTVELIFVDVEVYNGHFVRFGQSSHPFKAYSRVSWI